MTVVLTPKELQQLYQDLCYKMLPLIGVNRRISNKWRILPERYQGVGLLNFEVHAFSKKMHFLQRKWDGKYSTSKMTSATCNAFMVDVGVHGNIFSRSWKELEVLATKHT